MDMPEYDRLCEELRKVREELSNILPRLPSAPALIKKLKERERDLFTAAQKAFVDGT